jgi:hypothetical protein
MPIKVGQRVRGDWFEGVANVTEVRPDGVIYVTDDDGHQLIPGLEEGLRVVSLFEEAEDVAWEFAHAPYNADCEKAIRRSQVILSRLVAWSESWRQMDRLFSVCQRKCRERLDAVGNPYALKREVRHMLGGDLVW